MEIANINHAGDDGNGHNNDNNDDVEDPGIVTEEDSMELENNRNLDKIKERLSNEWIGSIASIEQVEYYAKKLIEVGFDSVDFIVEYIDFEDYEGRFVDAIGFMDPVHKQVFIQNVSNIKRENEKNNNKK